MKKIKDEKLLRKLSGGYECSCGARFRNDFWGWCGMAAHITLWTGRGWPTKDGYCYHYWK